MPPTILLRQFVLMPQISDDFNRANENPLSGGGVWTTPAIFTFSMQLVSNAATPNSVAGSDNGSIYTGADVPNDQWAKANFTVTGTNGNQQGLELILRSTSDGVNRNDYRFIADHGSPNVAINKMVNNASSNLVQTTVAWNDGDEFIAIVIGKWLGFFRSRQLMIQAVDSSHAAGDVGIGLSTSVTTASLDNFVAGGVQTRFESATRYPKPQFAQALLVGGIR